MFNPAVFSKNKKRARREACTLILDGYRLIAEVEFKERMLMTLVHAPSNNRITLVADGQHLQIYKNHKLVKLS